MGDAKSSECLTNATYQQTKREKQERILLKNEIIEREIINKCGFTTRAIHAGHEPEESTGAVAPPIYMTSTYLQFSPADLIQGYDYTRAGNPNFTRLEKQVAALEHSKYATVFTAGMSALTALLADVSKDDGGVCALRSCYGGTYRLLINVFEKIGTKVHLVKVGDYEGLENIFKNNKIKYFIFETPTNPLLEIVDINKVVNIAKNYNVLTVLDNTFATPFHQLGTLRGVDVILHSTTKYMGGHSDAIGGVICTNNERIKEQCDFFRKSMGLNPSPFDAWLIARSVKTLGLRMQRHASNALKLAEYLSDHEDVTNVYYPGLKFKNKRQNKENEFYSVAVSQMRNGFSGIVSVEFNFDLHTIEQLISSFKLFALAESLGGVESLVDHPSSMTHASIPHEERIAIGIADGLVRFSVGVEDYEDLKNDIENAIQLVKQK